VGEKHRKASGFGSSAPHFGNILAIFEPVVEDFCEDFSNKGFFDSLVGRQEDVVNQ
jgi:hypothetical protein